MKGMDSNVHVEMTTVKKNTFNINQAILAIYISHLLISSTYMYTGERISTTSQILIGQLCYMYMIYSPWRATASDQESNKHIIYVNPTKWAAYNKVAHTYQVSVNTCTLLVTKQRYREEAHNWARYSSQETNV